MYFFLLVCCILPTITVVKSSENEMITVGATSGPVHLGSLYDARSDTVLPGLSLWDLSTIESKKVSNPNGYTNSLVSAATKLNDKLSLLDIGASVTISIMSGALVLTGSAKFLLSDYDINDKYAVNIVYTSKTRMDQLPMELLAAGGFEHPEVLSKNMATHVVTGIWYGSDAVLEFASTNKLVGNKFHLDASITLNVSKSFEIYISGSINMTTSNDKGNGGLTCKFNGDSVPAENPSEIRAAMRVFRNLPTYVGPKGEFAVPKQISLLPLSVLDLKTTGNIKKISGDIVKMTVDFMDEMSSYKAKIEEFRQRNVVDLFKELSDDLNKLKSAVHSFTLLIQVKLAQILPLVRGTGVSETILAHVIWRRSSSPFTADLLAKYFTKFDDLTTVLDSYILRLNNGKIKFALEPKTFVRTLNDISCDKLFILTLKIYSTKPDPYLVHAARYLNNDTVFDEYQPEVKQVVKSNRRNCENNRWNYGNHDNYGTNTRIRCKNVTKIVKNETEDETIYDENKMISDLRDQQNWFSDISTVAKMGYEGRKFFKLSQSNQFSDSIWFVVATEESEIVSAEVTTFDGTFEALTLITDPKNLTVTDITPNSAKLTWNPPMNPAIQVEDYVVKLSSGTNSTSLIPVKGEKQIRLKNLSRNTVYNASVAVQINELGELGLMSDSVRFQTH